MSTKTLNIDGEDYCLPGWRLLIDYDDAYDYDCDAGGWLGSGVRWNGEPPQARNDLHEALRAWWETLSAEVLQQLVADKRLARDQGGGAHQPRVH